ncbi:hypothetical protein [Mesorhizobium sp. M0578]|uniref:hypothetical protein n=1 Tax=unclassified Mesorhizobium TaxID=325217 RepID=UPI00333C3A7F
MSEASEHAGMKGEVPVYRPNRNLSLRCCVLVQVSDTIKVNSVEGGMCVALNTSGAAIAADAVLIIGLHDDDNSVRQ